VRYRHARSRHPAEQWRVLVLALTGNGSPHPAHRRAFRFCCFASFRFWYAREFAARRAHLLEQ
jgi:hypothetical protein